MNKKKIGIFGGTFNPPHIGHIDAAKAFVKAINPDKLLIVPSYLPPHKAVNEVISPEQRLAMCRIAFRGIDGAEISDIEISRGGKSYTYITLEELSDWNTELYFLVGTDMFLTLDEWRFPEKIFSLAKIYFVRRESDCGLDGKIEEKKLLYREKFGAEITEIRKNVLQMSSSDVRILISEGKDATELVTSEVMEYIEGHNLYGASDEKKLRELKNNVRPLMSEKRFLHTLSVEETAKELAELFIPDKVFDIRAAAILHDVTKEFDLDRQISMLNEDGVELTEGDRMSPGVIHSFSGASYIKRNFHEFSTPEILSAVFKHTLGDGDMSLFEKIIYLSDYAEKTREYDSCKRVRKFLFEDIHSLDYQGRLKRLDDACLMATDGIISAIKAAGRPLNERVFITRNSLLQKKIQI